jgi:hypothetical protein
MPVVEQKSSRGRGQRTMIAQPWLHTDIVRLKKAVLCANCEVISEGLNGHCAACGSEALLRLHELLGGTADVDLNFEIRPVLSERTSGRLSFAA